MAEYYPGIKAPSMNIFSYEMIPRLETAGFFVKDDTIYGIKLKVEETDAAGPSEGLVVSGPAVTAGASLPALKPAFAAVAVAN